MKIFLIGPQGSGKSTQAKLLSKFLGLPYISTGDIFRKMRDEIKQILDQGKLVGDATTAKIVKEKLQEEKYQKGFVMDGYPRNLEQLKLFDPSFDKVIYLNVPQDEVIRRLTQRGRSDDTPQSIKRRLDLYYRQTQPLLDFYKNKGILLEVLASENIQTVQDEIKKSL